MCSKVTRVSEAFVALLAVMEFLPSVDLHVLLKLSRSLEGLRTLVTRVRLDLTMNQHMCLQIPSLSESFGTQVEALNDCEQACGSLDSHIE